MTATIAATQGMAAVRVTLKALATSMLAALVSATHCAHAADAPRGQIVANGNACMGCHAVDSKRVGPSFLQIAAKYKGDPQAEANLARKVRNGGSGVWGMIPMPAHPAMNDADIRSVVDWVLAGAPSK
jgi:cytochrome c